MKRNPIFTYHIGQYWIESSFSIQYSVFRIFYSICICIYISLIIAILSFRFVKLHIFSSRRIYICSIIFWKTGYVSSFIVGIEFIPSILYTLEIIYVLSKTFILFYQTVLYLIPIFWFLLTLTEFIKTFGIIPSGCI
nr:MAG TPA: hypothetical protein [Caudoviricetes sp.]